MKYTFHRVPASDIRDGNIIKMRDGIAQVIEAYKNLSEDKYTHGVTIEFQYLATKIKSTVTKGVNDMIEVRIC